MAVIYRRKKPEESEKPMDFIKPYPFKEYKKKRKLRYSERLRKFVETSGGATRSY